MTRTEAGRDTFDRWSDVVEDPERLRADILAIEAEAAARDAERVVRDMRYHPSLSGKSEDYIAGWDAAAVLLAEAAAGPRDGCAYQCPHDKATHERYPNDIDHDYVEAAAGPRDLFAASDLDDP